ncbi:PREDICTED: dolichyl-diphosphooligosaccharide--protein glycosyltransferase subunit 2-like, partial [Acropora digitifera]|uniref:dolichyl-diphosphooligosaccharide--protein glycosyltransferase subunit 2-like n=1 Tax=Acropora digitifera TaxID=70779 RepID=UPI00077A7545
KVKHNYFDIFPQDVCKFAKDNVDNSDVKSIFHASVIAEFVGSCKLVVDDAVKTILSEAVNEGTDMVTLYYAVVAQSFLGIKVSSDEVIKAIKAAINTDEDSILGAAYAMLIGERLAKGADVSFIAEMIEDTVAQADEIDNQYLQFEGGLHPTSLVVYATYTFSEYSGKAPAITEEQVIKFANYLLTRKHVQSVKETATLFLALDKLGNNPFHVPVVVQLYGSPVVSDDQKLVKVGTLYKGILPLEAIKETVISVVVCLSFVSYELNFMTSKPGPGVYSISFSVKPHKEDKRLIGTSSGQVKVKVVTKVSVEDVELSVLDKEQNIKSKTMSVKYPTAISTVIDADYHQKVVMKFSLKSESSGDLFTPHQAFVRLTNEKTKQEIFFVTEPEPSKVFKFDLDVGATAKDSFGSLSGKYKMELIVGDAVIQNPFEWNIGVLSLTFAQEAAKPSKDKESMYSSRPEIEHMFRVPEKRPPKAVSTAFTVLIFVPLVIMLVVWMKLGANISNFPFSLLISDSRLWNKLPCFLNSFPAILALYVCFFISLNMFSTLKILALIGGLTFLGGNSLLSSIAARRSAGYKTIIKDK